MHDLHPYHRALVTDKLSWDLTEETLLSLGIQGGIQEDTADRATACRGSRLLLVGEGEPKVETRDTPARSGE